MNHLTFSGEHAGYQQTRLDRADPSRTSRGSSRNAAASPAGCLPSSDQPNRLGSADKMRWQALCHATRSLAGQEERGSDRTILRRHPAMAQISDHRGKMLLASSVQPDVAPHRRGRSFVPEDLRNQRIVCRELLQEHRTRNVPELVGCDAQSCPLLDRVSDLSAQKVRGLHPPFMPGKSQRSFEPRSSTGRYQVHILGNERSQSSIERELEVDVILDLVTLVL